MNAHELNNTDPPMNPDDGPLSVLATCEPFSTLSPEVVRLLDCQLTERPFTEGEFLLRQGDPGDSLLVLAEGVVEINTVDETGQHFIGRAGRGEVLGEMALLTNERRSANVVALSPGRALVLAAEAFHRLAAEHPTISIVLTHLVAQRLGGPRRDVLAGKTLGDYRIQRRLGRGGMAVVYEAAHVTDRQRVALKMMSHRLVYEAGALAQFQREADLIESFAYDDIVRMFGRFAAFHTYFLVLEYCDGRPLDEVIRAHGPLPEPEIRKVFARVGRALAYANAHGIVHRDIKPANIMLNRDGSVKLMDFGLAMPVDDDDMLDGTLVGTPRYMAPEQLSRGAVDHHSDLFSLGCVGYEMLTGQPLFAELSIGRLIAARARWRPPSLKKLRPDASDELCHAIERCLNTNPTARGLDQAALAGWSGPIDASLVNSHALHPAIDPAAVTLVE